MLQKKKKNIGRNWLGIMYLKKKKKKKFVPQSTHILKEIGWGLWSVKKKNIISYPSK